METEKTKTATKTVVDEKQKELDELNKRIERKQAQKTLFKKGIAAMAQENADFIADNIDAIYLLLSEFDETISYCQKKRNELMGDVVSDLSESLLKHIGFKRVDETTEEKKNVDL